MVVGEKGTFDFVLSKAFLEKTTYTEFGDVFQKLKGTKKAFVILHDACDLYQEHIHVVLTVQQRHKKIGYVESILRGALSLPKGGNDFIKNISYEIKEGDFAKVIGDLLNSESLIFHNGQKLESGTGILACAWRLSNQMETDSKPKTKDCLAILIPKLREKKALIKNTELAELADLKTAMDNLTIDTSKQSVRTKMLHWDFLRAKFEEKVFGQVIFRCSSHLFNRVCPSIRPSVRPSVRRSVTPL